MRLRPSDVLVCSALLLAACTRADRIELKPSSVQFVGTGKTSELRAAPFARNGRHVPKPPCRWTSTDEKVVKVAGRGNDATLTSVAPGEATVRCAIGGTQAELPVQVRVVSRLTVRPERAELKLVDSPTPLALAVDAYDDRGAPVASRSATVLCQDETVCRGDGRAQVWPVGPGETTARVELEGAAVTLSVKVVEARSADARPKAVKGNYAEDVVKMFEQRQREEKAAEERAAKAAAKAAAKRK